jgi:LptA/(LptD N-terminal domain) LPS transport protein
VGRVKSIAGLSVIAVLAGVPLAQAGIPRGAILIADEQDADPETGVTIARGNAEIKFDKQPIAGHADSIELNPASNQIVFKGRAVLSVGRDHFESETVTCGLDFSKCTVGTAAVVQALPVSAPVSSPADAAVINPR